MKIFTLLILCSFFSCKSEKTQAQEPNHAVKYAFNIPNLQLTDYDHYQMKYNIDYDFTFGGDYDGFNDPEEVLLVHVSLVDASWFPNLYFTKEDAPRISREVIVKRRQDLDYREKNFYELQRKFSFLYAEKEVNVIVIHEYRNNTFVKKKNFVISKDDDDKYKVLTRHQGELKQLTDFFAHIKPDILDILEQQYLFKTDDEVLAFLGDMRERRLIELKPQFLFPPNDHLIIEIYEQTRTDLNNFSLKKFFVLIETWKNDGDTARLNYVYDSGF